MRDLSGRRVRHIEQQRALEEFTPPTEERMAEIRADFDSISKTGREVEKRECFFGAACKYRYKCKYLHPGQSPSDLKVNRAVLKSKGQDKVVEEEERRRKSMLKAARDMEASMKRAMKLMKTKKKIIAKKC